MVRILLCRTCKCIPIRFSISVFVLFERTCLRNIDVLCLIVRKLCELSTKRWQVICGNFLVQFLRKHIHFSFFVFCVISVSPKFDLCKNLVRERARHHEGWMSSGATEIKETSRSENDNSVTIWELEAVDLILDILAFDSWIGVQSSHVDFVIEMSNISNNSVVLHLCHIFDHDNLIVSSCSDEDICSFNDT